MKITEDINKLNDTNLEDTKEPLSTSLTEEYKNLRIIGSMRTDVGNVREINQDCMLTMQITLNECCKFTQPRLFIVADGMGGGADGEVASSMAIRAVAKYIINNLLPLNSDISIDSSILTKAVEAANLEIYNYGHEDPSREGMGSTITSALVIGNKMFIGHVGDTRAYIINKDGVRQITEDHSLVTRLLKMGQLTPEQAKNYPHKNLIYRTLGAHPQLEVAAYEEELKVGDTGLICCDGLWDYFPEEEMYEIVNNSKNFDRTTEDFINLANERGGKDNITVVMFKLIADKQSI